MPVPINPATAGAVAQGVTGIGGSIASIVNTNKTIKANKQLAEYAYSKDLEMWNRQNQYNSPQAQMERLKAGGLNPNLMYGQGNVGNASTLPKYQAPKVDYNYQPPNFGGVITSYINTKQQIAQIDQIQANTKRIDQLTTNEAINETLKGLEKQIKQLEISKRSENLSWLPGSLEQRWRMNEAQMKNIEVGTQLKKYQTSFTEAKTNEINRLLGLKANLLDAQVKNTISNTSLNPWKAENLMMQSAGISSAIKLRDQNMLNLEEMRKLLEKQNKVFYINSGFDWWKSFKGTRNQSLNTLMNMNPFKKQ